MNPLLSEAQKDQLDDIMNSVQMSSILDHIGAQTFEAADAVDGDARDSLMQQAATICAAALFCRTWS